MSEPVSILKPGRIVDWDRQPGKEPVPIRQIDPAVSNFALSMVGPDLSFENAMRLLFPEEAAEMYNPGRWPCGPSRT